MLSKELKLCFCLLSKAVVALALDCKKIFLESARGISPLPRQFSNLDTTHFLAVSLLLHDTSML